MASAGAGFIAVPAGGRDKPALQSAWPAEEAGLRSLLGAVEAPEGDSAPSHVTDGRS